MMLWHNHEFMNGTNDFKRAKSSKMMGVLSITDKTLKQKIKRLSLIIEHAPLDGLLNVLKRKRVQITENYNYKNI